MIHNLRCKDCSHEWRQGAFTKHLPHVACSKCHSNNIESAGRKIYDPEELDRKEKERRAKIMLDSPLTILKPKQDAKQNTLPIKNNNNSEINPRLRAALGAK